MKSFFLFIIGLIIISSCITAKDKDKAYDYTLQLFDSIASGNANKMFPAEYFSRQQTNDLMLQLKNDCDFKNRKGNFLNDYYRLINNDNIISELFEFHLKCADERFIVSYYVKGGNLKLFNFQIESVEMDNAMIKNPERRIWKRRY